MGAAVSVNHYERAFRAWPLLADCAAKRSKITYGDVGVYLNIHHRPVRLVLAIIQDWCLYERKPPLTILVVKKEGKEPGEGFIAWDASNLDDGYEEVYRFPWYALSNPFQFAAQGNATPLSLAREIITRPQDAADVYQKVKSRGIAQDVFRRALLEAYGRRCAFCGLSLHAALQAAHIVPWGAATQEQRVSPVNGLLLCSTHHALFDAGILSVSVGRTIRCRQERIPGHQWTAADQRVVADLDGHPVWLPADTRLWPAAAALAHREAH
jgi:putative restriction endonuclease